MLDSEITDFSVESIGANTGFAGSVYRIHLRMRGPGSDGTDESTIIWKTGSAHPSTDRLLVLLGAYQTEADFYEKVGPTVRIAPKCYTSQYHAESTSLSILMEDLSSMEPGDQIKGCAPDQAYVVVGALAELHAQFRSDRLRNLLGGIPTFDMGSDIFGQLHSRAWLQMQQSTIEVPQGLFEAAERIAPHVASIKSRLAASPTTLVHGDVRGDNLFFGENDLKLIDWQAIRVGRGGYDLAYFLATSLPTELRRRHQSGLIETYVEALRSHGTADYNVATCLEDIRWGLLDMITFTGIVGSALDFGSGRGLQLADVMMARLWASLDDNRALDLLGPLPAR